MEDSAKYKVKFNIGVFNVPNNSSNYLLKKEVLLGYGSKTYYDLKVSVLAITSHYGCEIMYNFEDFLLLELETADIICITIIYLYKIFKIINLYN